MCVSRKNKGKKGERGKMSGWDRGKKEERERGRNGERRKEGRRDNIPEFFFYFCPDKTVLDYAILFFPRNYTKTCNFLKYLISEHIEISFLVKNCKPFHYSIIHFKSNNIGH